MKRVIMILALVLIPAACIDPDDGRSYGGPYGHSGCRQFTSCATCTPVIGCGWCSAGQKGLCTDQPNNCAVPGLATFTWIWEPNYCPATADAGTEVGGNGDGGAATDSGVNADGGDGASGDVGDGA